MAMLYFDLPAMKELDGGRVAEAFSQAVKRAVLDCEDRPGEERPRKILLSLELTPSMEDGGLDGIGAKFQVRDQIPTRRSRLYNFGVKAGGKVFFSTEDPTNHRQFGFNDADETGRVEQTDPAE